ncbi:MAG: hypothetical protein U0Q15_07350 [Kineosporiaceae bacterium]
MAQAEYDGNVEKVKRSGVKIVKVLAEVTGVTDGWDCITKGDMGACAKTLLNVAPILLGGVAAKLLEKYGVPWKWKTAAQVLGELGEAGTALLQGFKDLLSARAVLQEATAVTEQVVAREVAVGAEAAVGEGGEALAVRAGEACPNSFTGDTRVLLADGSAKPIKDVAVEDVGRPWRCPGATRARSRCSGSGAL